MTAEDYIDRMNCIIRDMLEYYSDHARGVCNGICSYTDGCAVAWACGFKSDVAEWDNEPNSTFLDIYEAYECDDKEDDLWAMFRPEYYIPAVEFWTQLQAFHDDSDYWDISPCGEFNTLSSDGEDRLEEIRSQFNDWAEDLAITEAYNDC